MAQQTPTIRAMTDADVPACRGILAEAFGAHAQHSPEAFERFEDEPWCSPADRMVAAVDGRVVSHCGLRTGELWIGGIAVPAVRLGAIATLDEFQKRRISSALVDRTCAEARRRGAVLAVAHAHDACARMLGGIAFGRGVYSKPAWQLELEKASEAALDRAKNAAGTYRYRPAVTADVAAIAELYYQHFSQLYGCWSRTESFWHRRVDRKHAPWTATAPELVVACADERTIAYIAVTKAPSKWDVIEFGCFAGYEDAIAGGCARLAREAQEAGVRWLGVDVSYADPVARGLVPLGLRGHVRYENVMLRVLDPAGLTERVFEALDLRTTGEAISCTVAVEGCPPRGFGTGTRDFSLAMGPEDLAVVFYNGASLQGMISAARAVVDPPGAIANAALKKLFPETHAYRSRLDPYEPI